MLDFLFLAVLALVIIIPTSIFASKLLNFNKKSLQSFESLVAEISSQDLEDGNINSIPFYLDKGSILAGFSKRSNKFEKHNYYTKNPNKDQIAYRFTRPNLDNCQIEKACICLCKDSYQGLQDPLPETTECNDAKCAAFDNINFLNEKITDKDEYGNPKSGIKGGFIFFSKSDSTLPNESIGTGTTLYVQRYKNFIDVCTNSPCINDESKAAINAAVSLDTIQLTKP